MISQCIWSAPMFAVILIATAVPSNIEAEVPCTNGGVTCITDARRLVETPSGAMNGENSVFVLAQVPASGSQIQLFRTGLRLTPNIDYTMNSRQIIMIGSAIPQPNDVLTAIYVPETGNARRERETGPPASIRETTTGADIAEVALREGLVAEMTLTRQVSSRLSTSEGARGLITPRSEQIGTSRPKHLSEPPAMGIDGLGDHLLSVQTLRRATTDTAQASSTNLGSSGNSAAMRMLDARVNAEKTAAGRSTKVNKGSSR